MSTQRAHEPFWHRWFGHHETTDWQRYLHQREEPEYIPEPDVPMGGLRQSAWVDQQLRQLGVVPPQQTGEMAQLPTTRVTEGMPRLLPPPTPKKQPSAGREWADVPTVKKLEKPEWLTAVLEGNRLTVERPQVVESVPPSGPIQDNTAAVDAMLLTLPPERIRQTEPWQPSGPMLPLPDWISNPSDSIDKWPTVHEVPGHSPMLTPVPMDPESNASTDQFSFGALVVIGNEATSAIDELTTLAQQKPNEDTLHVPAVMKKQHTKESE